MEQITFEKAMNLKSDLIPSGKEIILNSATRLFIERGFNGVSMREIAEASKLTKAALYYHFKDKEDLLCEVFYQFLNEIEREIQIIQSQDLSVRRKIRNFISLLMNQSAEKLGIIHLVFIESGHLGNNFRKEIGQKYHSLFLGSLEALMEEGIQKKEIYPMDTKQASQLLFGMLYANFHPQPLMNSEKKQGTADFITQIFFDGVQVKS